MRRSRPIPLAFALGLLAACEGSCPNTLVTGGDAATGPPVEVIWTLDQPYPGIANLNGVWGYSHDDVWAVGTGGTILHFNGSTWTQVPSPTTQDLYDIDGHESMQDGDKDIYAVGASGTIIHTVEGANGELLWALEDPVVDGRRLDGRNVEDTLMGVWHGGRQGIYVVGEKGTVLAKRGDPNDSTVPMTWSLMLDELVQNRLPVCETRVAYDGDGYPTGGGPGGTCAPCNYAAPTDASGNVVTQDDGSPLPRSMWTCQSSAGTAVPYCPGPDYSTLDCEIPSTMRRGEDPQCSFGQRCAEDGSPMYQITFFPVDLKSVVGYGSGADLRVVAVGESGAVMELRPDGSSGAGANWNCEGFTPAQRPASCWRPVARAGNSENPAVRDTLAGVWGTWSSNIHAVGEDGRILWRNGDDEWVRGTDVTQAEWLRAFLSPPTPVFLRDLWHQGRNDFFVVGFSGIVLHHTEGEWLVEEVPTTAHLRAVWGKTRDDLDAGSRDASAPALRTVIAVGAEGVILRRAIAR